MSKMNDFTKEELEYLYEMMSTISIAGHPIDDDELYEKIQSMIDNYCEHAWHPGGNRPWLHCIKCKANFHHERI